MGFFRNLRTAFDSADRLNELADSYDQLLAEWANYRSRFDTLLRRLSMRTSMERPDIPDRSGLPVSERKQALRARAKAQGLLP